MLQWGGSACVPIGRPGTVAQARCLLQLCPTTPTMCMALEIIRCHTGAPWVLSSGLPLADRQVEVKLWRTDVRRNSVSFFICKTSENMSGKIH